MVAARPVEADVYDALVLGVRDYLGKNGFPGALIGLSGGVDSALTLAIAAQVSGRWFLLPLLALPRAIGLARALPVAPAGAAQNALLFRTVMLEVAFGLLLSLGALLHRAT